MALSGKYISTFEIIRSVYRDTKMTIELSWQDAIEWAVEAVQLIGAPNALRANIACVPIEHNRGKLPCDLETLTQASGLIDNVQFPMRGTTDTFHPVFTCTSPSGASLSTGFTVDSSNPIGTDINGNAVFNFTTDDTTVSNPNQNIIKSSIVAAGGSHPNSATYSTNDNYIFTSFSEGFVLLAYKAYPIDENGFPLIPDNIKYKKAVAAYIRMMIDYQLWRTDDISESKFRYSEQEWQWYVGAAGNAARMPSIDQAQSWLNQHLVLMPRLNLHGNFFRNMGDQQEFRTSW